jgi:uncharacterized protein with PIN domain
MNDTITAKLYLDEDVHKRIADSLRLRGFDVVSAHEVERMGLTDLEQLACAVSERHALVTFNVADYMRLNREYLSSGKEHHGIILSEQLPVGKMVRRLLKLLNEFSAADLKNNVWWL